MNTVPGIMLRKTLRSQVEDLKQDNERLEAENTHLQETLQAELKRLREENERLSREKREADACHDPTRDDERSKADKLLEEQQQLYEDMQAELAEAVDRGNTLEDKR